MRSRILSTLAAVTAGVALTAGAVGVAGSALGGPDSSSSTQQAGKIMARLPAAANLNDPAGRN